MPDANDSAVRFYIVELTCQGLDARVTLNGWPVARSVSPVHEFVGTKVNAWLLEGDNRLEVSVASLTPGADTSEAALYVHLYVTDPGRPMTDDDVLVVYRWSPREAPLAESLPAEARPASGRRTVFSHTLRVPSAFGPYLWQDAAPYQESDRADVLALLTQLHRVLAQKDMPGLLDLLAIKHEEMARAIGKTAAGMAAQEQTLIDEFYFSASSWELAPLTPAELSFDPWAGGRLVEIRHGEWPHPILGRSDYRFGFDLVVSHLYDGPDGWRIVR